MNMFTFSLRPQFVAIWLHCQVYAEELCWHLDTSNLFTHSTCYATHSLSLSYQYSSQYYSELWSEFKTYITFSFSFSSPGVPGHWFRLHGKHQTESCSNTSQGLRDVTRPDRIQIRSVATMSPGKMKIKKALIPPMTLMTLLMSGTNMAMSTVTAIHRTVSM